MVGKSGSAVYPGTAHLWGYDTVTVDSGSSSSRSRSRSGGNSEDRQRQDCQNKGAYWDSSHNQCKKFYRIKSYGAALSIPPATADANVGFSKSEDSELYVFKKSGNADGFCCNAEYEDHDSQATSSDTVRSLSLTFRSDKDPYVVAVKLTDGSLDFGLTLKQKREIGGSLLGFGVLMTCCLCVVAAVVFKKCGKDKTKRQNFVGRLQHGKNYQPVQGVPVYSPHDGGTPYQQQGDAYGAPQAGYQPGYPPPQPGYPQQAGPPGAGYPQQLASYPPQPGAGYPPQPGAGYPPQPPNAGPNPPWGAAPAQPPAAYPQQGVWGAPQAPAGPPPAANPYGAYPPGPTGTMNEASEPWKASPSGAA